MARLCFLTTTTLAAFLVVALSAGATASAAEDGPNWPQFHGPNRDNISTDEGLLKEWPEGGPPLVWTARGIGHGFASVSIAGGRIYTAGDIEGNTVITAMDLDGRKLWQVPNGEAWKGTPPGARSTPTIDGDRLYHESPTGNVICLDAVTGKPIWDLNILEEFGSRNIEWAVSESLLIDGDRVICSPGGPDTAVVALDKGTGRTVWRSPSSGDLAGYASPALAEHEGLRMILTLTSQALIGVNADTGDLLWRFQHKTPFEENILMPIFHEGQVFISTRTTGSVMLKIDVDGDKASVTPVWHSTQLDNQHGGVVLLDGYLYGACHVRNNAKWVCLDWNTGKEMYAERGIGKGSLTYAEGMLYVFNERRGMALVKASPSGHEIVGEFRIPDEGRGPTWAHPVVCGGELYIRHGDVLFVYDVRARK